MIDAKTVGERLIKLRGNERREAVAKALNISVSALQMYENGRRMPRDEVKVRISQYYGESIYSIFYAQ